MYPIWYLRIRELPNGLPKPLFICWGETGTIWSCWCLYEKKIEIMIRSHFLWICKFFEDRRKSFTKDRSSRTIKKILEHRRRRCSSYYKHSIEYFFTSYHMIRFLRLLFLVKYEQDQILLEPPTQTYFSPSYKGLLCNKCVRSSRTSMEKLYDFISLSTFRVGFVWARVVAFVFFCY